MRPCNGFDWYNVELKETYANLFRHWLRANDIYFESSDVGVAGLIHFECFMTEDKAKEADVLLDLIREVD